jgi:hypothetical protein
MDRLLPVMVFLISLAAVAVAATGADRDARQLAAVYPPWWNASRIMGAAGSAGDIAAAGGWRNVMILRSQTPGLAARLRRSGALWTMDARLAGVCGDQFNGRAADVL